MRALVALLAVAVLLGAGCIGASKDNKNVPVNQTALDNSTIKNATLPDGRGVSNGNLETNKTETGMGGVQHQHDYWKGKETATLVSDVFYFNAFPVYPGGEGSEPGSIAYIKLPIGDNTSGPILVYEGAIEVDVTAKMMGGCFVDESSCAPDPQMPSLLLRYRSAADSKFRDAGPIADGATVKIPITPKETDMPHSHSSLWAWEIVADKPTQDAINVTITVKRGADILNWPGHPDFYADKTERVIADKEVKVHRNGAEENLLYGSASSWVAPDKLVSYGTGSLDVFINITKATASNGASPTNFFLEYHNATLLDEEDTFNERLGDHEKKNDLQHYHFVVKVDPNGMDGPYQPGSLWGFRPVAEFATILPPAGPYSSIGLCPGCFPYDIEYHLTIIARKGDAATQVLSG